MISKPFYILRSYDSTDGGGHGDIRRTNPAHRSITADGACKAIKSAQTWLGFISGLEIGLTSLGGSYSQLLTSHFKKRNFLFFDPIGELA